jgi:hypothetical protein
MGAAPVDCRRWVDVPLVTLYPDQCAIDPSGGGGGRGADGWVRRSGSDWRGGQAGWRAAICWLMTVETPSPRMVMP